MKMLNKRRHAVKQYGLWVILKPSIISHYSGIQIRKTCSSYYSCTFIYFYSGKLQSCLVDRVRQRDYHHCDCSFLVRM